MQTKDETKYVNLEVLKTLKTRKEYTYKGLCDDGLFKNGYKTGNTKKAQIEELKQFADLTIKSGKIKFSKFYETRQLPQIINNEFNENMNTLLLKYTSDMLAIERDNGNTKYTKAGNEYYEILATPNQLMGYLNLVNEVNFNNKPDIVAESLKTDIGVTKDVMNNIQQNNYRSIQSALFRLDNESYLTSIKTYIGVYKDGDEYIHVALDDLEIADIKLIERKILDETKCKNIGEVINNRDLLPIYHKHMKPTLYKLGYNYVYRGFKISGTVEALERGISQRKVKDARIFINKEATQRAHDRLISRYEKVKKKLSTLEEFIQEQADIMDLWSEEEQVKMINDDLSITQKCILKDNYLDDGHKVIDVVMSSKSRKKIKSVE